jgi:hypothetical protein
LRNKGIGTEQKISGARAGNGQNVDTVVDRRIKFGYSQCHHNATMPQCHNNTMPQYHNATIPQCHNATMPQIHKSTIPQRHRNEKNISNVPVWMEREKKLITENLALLKNSAQNV